METIDSKVLYPDLSYQIVGALYEVWNTLGPNHREKYYQNALIQEFRERGIPFVAQYPIDLIYKGKVVGKNYLDFVIDGKIVIEIKAGPRFTKKGFDQVFDYLKTGNFKLGIIVLFCNDGVKYKRVLNRY